MLMEQRVESIEKEIEALKQRNARVEADKAWETSSVRIFSIAVVTYLIASLLLFFIGAKNVLSNALIPVIGYYLSTRSLPLIKKWWEERF